MKLLIRYLGSSSRGWRPLPLSLALSRSPLCGKVAACAIFQEGIVVNRPKVAHRAFSSTTASSFDYDFLAQSHRFLDRFKNERDLPANSSDVITVLLVPKSHMSHMIPRLMESVDIELYKVVNNIESADSEPFSGSNDSSSNSALKDNSVNENDSLSKTLFPTNRLLNFQSCSRRPSDQYMAPRRVVFLQCKESSQYETEPYNKLFRSFASFQIQATCVKRDSFSNHNYLGQSLVVEVATSAAPLPFDKCRLPTINVSCSSTNSRDLRKIIFF
jgi:hypothetical protein